MDIKTSQQKTMTGVIGLAILAAISAWPFYLFVALKGAGGAVDVQGGTIHLWIGIAIGLITSVTGFFLISSFLRCDRETKFILLPRDVLKG